MSWKEFFKPSKEKIILTLILGMIAFLIGITWCEPTCRFSIFVFSSPKESLVACCDVVLNPILWGPASIFLIQQNPFIYGIMNSLTIVLAITEIILGIIYWYILSSLILWIFNRVKKKCLKK